MSSKDAIRELEKKTNKEIMQLIKLLSTPNSSKALIELMDIVVKSDCEITKELSFVRRAVSAYAKNGRLVDAKNIADRFFECSNIDPENRSLDALKIEVEDVCRRLANGDSNPEPTSQYYDAVYSKSLAYQQDPEDSIYIKVWASVMRLINNLKPLRVIDIGCGPGQFAEYFLDMYNRGAYIGIDTSHTAIDLARAKNGSGVFYCCALNQLEEELIEQADCFIALEVLEHVKDDLGLIRSIPQGRRLIFSVPNFDSFGHMRYFANAAEVKARYESALCSLTVEAIWLTESSAIYLANGIVG
jgi:2-polyprenyl-3-methyl-5-hydroxy-6-metoxy-1,4-benzoquinol methylase